MNDAYGRQLVSAIYEPLSRYNSKAKPFLESWAKEPLLIVLALPTVYIVLGM